MDIDTLNKLLRKAEGRTLDFKEKAYDIRDDKSKADFIKDLVCMANTPRDSDAQILLGVENKLQPNGSRTIKGIADSINFADFYNVAASLVDPVPDFEYSETTIDGKLVGAISIHLTPGQRGPFFRRPGSGNKNQYLKEHPDFFAENRLYWRPADTNVLADSVGQSEIWTWFKVGRVEASATENRDQWDRFVEQVENLEYDPARHLILISGPHLQGTGANLQVLGRVSWSAVFDFDSTSEADGLLKACRPTLTALRNIHLAKPGDAPMVHHFRSGTFWYAARGMSDMPATLTSAWKDWNTRHGSHLKNQLASVASTCSPMPIICVVLWYDTASKRYLQSAIESAQQAFGSTARFVLLTTDAAEFRSIAEDCDGEVLTIPISQLCGGLEQWLTSNLTIVGDVSLPSSSGAPIPIPSKDLHWLEEELEITHINIGQASTDEKAGQNFYRGSEVSWVDLANRCDVDRDVLDKVRRRLRDDLTGRKISRVNLYHEAGAGGTTVARRLLWELHRDFPCVVLRSTVPLATAGRLEAIKTLTGLPVLVLVDGEQVARRRQIDDLYNELASRGVAAVLFIIQRRSGVQQTRERAFDLRSALSPEEAYRFAQAFIREVPYRKRQIEKLLTQKGHLRSAFYFGLEAFETGFKGLKKYIAARLPSADAASSRKILGFLSLAYHYAQQPLPAQLFADLLGIPQSKVVNLRSLFTDSSLELLVEVEHGRWRPTHDLVAKEILEQLLQPPLGDRRLWTQGLSTWAKEFAWVCRGNQNVPSNDMLDVVLRTFIFRENDELIGTERSAATQFAPLIEQIPSSAGRLEVLRTLTEIYPEEPHLWAHLGRFYSLQLRDHKEALSCITQALRLNNNDDRLHHMQGMCLRTQVNEYIGEGRDLTEIIEVAKQAASAFERARELDPESEHSHISEVQMLIRLLDYAAQQYKGDLSKYMIAPTADPFIREAVQRSEELLERVGRNREGEDSSAYEEDCRAQLDRLYGQLPNALQIWNNLLDRVDVYKPPLRRQIVWTLLSRHSRSWGGLTQKQVDQIISHLEANLQEDPSNSSDMRLWVQAIRKTNHPPSLESVIERVSYWRNTKGSLDADYYLYVFYALKALDFSKDALENAERFMDECRRKAIHRRNRTKSFEWIGSGSGIARLVHKNELGEWDANIDFWANVSPLMRLHGRINRVETSKGELELECGLKAFFNPRLRFFPGKSENQRVSFYLGFSYDGLRAWDVQSA